MDNSSLFQLIFGLTNQSPLADYFMIFGAEFILYLSFILGLLVAIKGKTLDKKAFILSILAIPLTIVIIKLIHLFYVTDRPFVLEKIAPLIFMEPNASFPSRHTAMMFTLAFSYIFYKSRWALAFLILTFWVGFARIFVGVHFPIDILGGMLVGLISTLTSWQIKKLVFKNTKL